MHHTKNRQQILFGIYLFLYLFFAIVLVIRQPFGNPPDEYNRFLIPKYIAEHGTLPNGYDESIRIYGYGFSYGFQPILPYMLQGYTMRLVAVFTDSQTALLYTARSVNVLLGLCMATVVWFLGSKWFQDRRFSVLFSFLVTFLPQSIYMHTYVNTDSCCMLSIAIMLYAVTEGLSHDFRIRDCVLLSVGIILCALSYYNAYGFILSCILLFTAGHLHRKSKLIFDWKNWLKKGCLISAIVLLGIAWWFIRSALLYDGDILGLTSRDQCALLYAIPQFHPDTRITWQNSGHSIFDMLKNSDFLNTSLLSFIGIYGAMEITSTIWMYRAYKYGFFLALILCMVISDKKTIHFGNSINKKTSLKNFFHGNMIFCILLPVFLSIWYSYTTDYQPQGRYLLPSLIPLAYYAVKGVEKFFSLSTPKHKFPERVISITIVFTLVLILFFLAVMIFGYALPFYQTLH